jgi:hypothetical protein
MFVVEHYPNWAWRKPGDFRIGLSKVRIAIAAALNVTQSGFSDDQFVDLVADVLLAFVRGRPSPLPYRRDEIARALRAEHFQAAPWRPRQIVPWDIDHVGFVTYLLHPQTGTGVGSVVASTLLECDIDAHAFALDQVRSRSRKAGDKAYQHLMAGRCGSVLQAIRAGKLPGHDKASLTQAVRTHAQCMVVRSGHGREGDIRLRSTAPLGDRFAGFNIWHSVGHTLLATVAAPAALLTRYPDIACDDRFVGAGDGRILRTLVSEKMMPARGGARIFRIVRAVIARLRADGIELLDTRPLLTAISEACAGASQLRAGDMKATGWSKMDFNELRFGLSATEASAFVALRMLQGLRQIDPCIEAIEAGRSPPSQDSTWLPSERRLAHANVMLRAEDLPDKAAKPHNPALDGNHIDESRGSGRTGVASMLRKIADPEIRQRAEKALGVDGTIWFRR